MTDPAPKPKTVPVYFIRGEDADGNTHDLGMFFRVIDADVHKPKGWRNVRVDAGALAEQDVHPAHRDHPAVIAALGKAK